MTEKTGKITSTNYPNLQTEANSVDRLGVLNGPKGSRFELTFTDLDLDDDYCGRFQHTVYLFDGLPNRNSLYNGQSIEIFHGGNLIDNQDQDLKRTSETNVVSVWMSIYDYGDYDYYDYYWHDYDCSDFQQQTSFRGFRLDWKLIE